MNIISRRNEAVPTVTTTTNCEQQLIGEVRNQQQQQLPVYRHQPQSRSASNSLILESDDVDHNDNDNDNDNDDDNDDDNDISPEALVRRETWWIRVFRRVVVVTLLLGAVGASLSTYKLSTKWEYDAFHSQFEAIASRITDSFLREAELHMSAAHLSSFAVTGNMISKVDNDNGLASEDTEFLVELTHVTRLSVGSRRAIWSPILYKESDLLAWEQYAQQEIDSVNQEGKFCSVCGTGMVVGDPSHKINFPGIGEYSCGDIEKYGRDGYLEPRECSLVSNYIKAPCQCKTDETYNTQNQTSVGPAAQGVFRMQNGKQVLVNGTRGPFSPAWIAAPPLPNQAILYDLLSDGTHGRAIREIVRTKLPVFSISTFPVFESLTEGAPEEPILSVFYPVFSSLRKGQVVGSICLQSVWTIFFSRFLPPGSDGVILVLENTMGQTLTYRIMNRSIYFMGVGDLHETAYSSMGKESSYEKFLAVQLNAAPSSYTGNLDASYNVGGHPADQWLYKVRVYPSYEFYSHYTTSKPAIYTSVVALTFLFTSSVFLVYDCLVRRRQSKVMLSAMQTDAIVSSLFPVNVRARVVGIGQQHQQQRHEQRWLSRHPSATSTKRRSYLQYAAPKFQLISWLGNSNNHGAASSTTIEFASEPIADFFPNVTVAFLDISGFTAWSSEREPSQVFRLLESVYQAFDRIAKALGVFKVETIGDCYVAATGLPQAQPDHAVIMTKFAFECIRQLHELTVILESSLGPGTSSLFIRVGMHSGPVIAGVLRGEKSRFQLFGDTMNTAARMQTTGKVSMIQASEATANLLIEGGKSHWITARNQLVAVKGKGDMQTFWLSLTTPAPPCGSEFVEPSEDESHEDVWDIGRLEDSIIKAFSPDEKFKRLIDWNVDLLDNLLQKVVAKRNGQNKCNNRRSLNRFQSLPIITEACSAIPMEDVSEFIVMPQFCEKDALDPDPIDLGHAVKTQLRAYVEVIASKYRNNPFHNFEHASHVAMSASKIMKRIIKPEGVDYSREFSEKRNSQQIHNSTFGISSDALMQFSVVYAALVHDVDHLGISNAQLVKEKHELAIKYNNKSVAEQHSIQTAWNLLMEDRFKDLRQCICATEEELLRFRRLVVNAVISTDIADKELQKQRKDRWDKAFSQSLPIKQHGADNYSSSDDEENFHRKATLVMEYIIQASDVAHTMQHWYIYSKWNRQLFEERYKAYLAGREEGEPSAGWYNGEIWFFDNYIIPLARKLETCGVFGVSSDEYLSYATDNRREWELKGHDAVCELVDKCTATFLNKNGTSETSETNGNRDNRRSAIEEEEEEEEEEGRRIAM